MLHKTSSLINSGKRTGFRAFHYTKKLAHCAAVIGEGFFVVYKNQLYKTPNDPKNTEYVQWFCQKLCKVFNIDVQVHGHADQQAIALWASNHVSWLDIPVLGSGARVFFLAKAEIEQWPVIGTLAKSGGTLFIKRGSGDSSKIREQITDFLKHNIPVLFFPEATTSDGTHILKIHGKLFGSAIEANQPVQVALLCYVNQQGELDTVAPFVGNIAMSDHLFRVLEMPKVTAHVMLMPAIPVAGHSMESLTHEVHKVMKKGLVDLHQKVLKHPTEFESM